MQGEDEIEIKKYILKNRERNRDEKETKPCLI
jgi:hypothetical protein